LTGDELRKQTDKEGWAGSQGRRSISYRKRSMIQKEGEGAGIVPQTLDFATLPTGECETPKKGNDYKEGRGLTEKKKGAGWLRSEVGQKSQGCHPPAQRIRRGEKGIMSRRVQRKGETCSGRRTAGSGGERISFEVGSFRRQGGRGGETQPTSWQSCTKVIPTKLITNSGRKGRRSQISPKTWESRGNFEKVLWEEKIVKKVSGRRKFSSSSLTENTGSTISDPGFEFPARQGNSWNRQQRGTKQKIER